MNDNRHFEQPPGGPRPYPPQPDGQPNQPYGQPNQPYGQPPHAYDRPQKPYQPPQAPYSGPRQPYGEPQQPYQQPYGQQQQPYGGPQQPYRPAPPTPPYTPAPPQPQTRAFGNPAPSYGGSAFNKDELRAKGSVTQSEKRGSQNRLLLIIFASVAVIAVIGIVIAVLKIPGPNFPDINLGGVLKPKDQTSSGTTDNPAQTVAPEDSSDNAATNGEGEWESHVTQKTHEIDHAEEDMIAADQEVDEFWNDVFGEPVETTESTGEAAKDPAGQTKDETGDKEDTQKGVQDPDFWDDDEPEDKESEPKGKSKTDVDFSAPLPAGGTWAEAWGEDWPIDAFVPEDTTVKNEIKGNSIYVYQGYFDADGALTQGMLMIYGDQGKTFEVLMGLFVDDELVDGYKSGASYRQDGTRYYYAQNGHFALPGEDGNDYDAYTCDSDWDDDNWVLEHISYNASLGHDTTELIDAHAEAPPYWVNVDKLD